MKKLVVFAAALLIANASVFGSGGKDLGHRPIFDISEYGVGTPENAHFDFSPSSFYRNGHITYDRNWGALFTIRGSEISFLIPPDAALTSGTGGIKYFIPTGSDMDENGNILAFAYKGDSRGYASDYILVYVNQPGSVTVQFVKFIFEQAGWHLGYVPTGEGIPISSKNYNPSIDHYWYVFNQKENAIKWVMK